MSTLNATMQAMPSIRLPNFHAVLNQTRKPTLIAIHSARSNSQLQNSEQIARCHLDHPIPTRSQLPTRHLIRELDTRHLLWDLAFNDSQRSQIRDVCIPTIQQRHARNDILRF